MRRGSPRRLWPLLLLLAACARLLGGWYWGAWPEAAGWSSRLERPSSSEACPPPLAEVLQGSPRFQRLFNLSTPVLLWGGLLTPQLWDRLAQLRGPYSWRGLSREALASALRLLNGSESAHLFPASPPSRRGPGPGCRRCAVVANGGILRGSRQGRRIDAHDYVFRLNGAVIRGFERDVGTRTSFYGFSVNTMRNSLANYRRLGFRSVPRGRGLRYIFIPTGIRDYLMLRSALLGVPVPEGEDKGHRPEAYFGPKAPAGTFKLLHPNFIDYLKVRFLNSSLLRTDTNDVYIPSTGALMLLTALHTCDQVSAYGFITKNYGDFSEHYYDRGKKPLKFYINHDLRLEATLWEELHEAGIIQLYQR